MFYLGAPWIVAVDWTSVCRRRLGYFRKSSRPPEKILECGQTLLDRWCGMRLRGDFFVGRGLDLDTVQRLEPFLVEEFTSRIILKVAEQDLFLQSSFFISLAVFLQRFRRARA